MAGKTYTWIGNSGSAYGAGNPSDWSPTGVPGAGDTAIVNQGTLLLTDPGLQSLSLYLGGGALDFFGDAATNPSDPTLDQNSFISTDAGLVETVSGSPQSAAINAFGNFVNNGTIDAAGPAGSTLGLLVSGITLGGTYYPGILTNNGDIEVAAGNKLTVSLIGNAELVNGDAFNVYGGYLDFAGGSGATVNNNNFNSDMVFLYGGGTVETNVNFNGGGIQFSDSTSGNTVKIDNLASFSTEIDNFGFHDTIDLGASLAVGTLVFNQSTGTLDLVHAGSIVGTVDLQNNNIGLNGTVALTGTIGVGSTATGGGLGLTLGSDGDTELFTVPTLYTYIGPAGSEINVDKTTLTVWSPVGNPNAGDSALVNAGTLLLPDANLTSNTIYFEGGTAIFAGSTNTAVEGYNNNSGSNSAPTTDQNSIIMTDAASVETVSGAAQNATVDAFGNFINEGSILANGPTGSTLTINVAGTTIVNVSTNYNNSGTITSTTTTSAYYPGYAINYGEIVADAGNTLIINASTNGALLNVGYIVADGGTVEINAGPSAISGGSEPVRGFDLIEGGGTIITAESYPATNGTAGTREYYQFADSTAGNTLKIENLGSFGGVIAGFGVGDTIDLGTLLTVGTIVYSTVTNLLTLEGAGGTTLASLGLGNFGTGVVSGTFAVTSGSADGFTFGVGTDGDTVLTTTGTVEESSNASGAWQSAGSWLGGIIPGTTASPAIGLNAIAPFTLTTGSGAVSVGGLGIDSSFATVQITSNTTLTTGQISDFLGTLDVTAGNTLTGAALQLYEPTASFTLAAGATVDLAGRINLDPAPANGIWSLQPGGNPYAFNVGAGTAVIDGMLIAGPTSSTRGGGTDIGYESTGVDATVIVNTGGTVTDTHDTLGSDLTSAGTLILDGPGASWSDLIDSADTFNSRGYITVGYNDLGSIVTAGLSLPAEVASAQVLIENGATLTDQEGGSIGSSYDSAGEMTVENGGVWNIAYNGVGGGINVGNLGSGTLDVLNGGTVMIGGTLTYTSNGSLVTTGGVGVGQTAGATGTIMVSGAGALFSTADGMAIGKGGQGLLEILNGGTVSVTGNGIGVGQTADAGSSGTIVVGGQGGSAAVLNFSAASTGLTVGNASQGTLIVSDSGTVNLNGSGYLTVGSTAAAVGTVVVGGINTSAVINIGTEGLTDGFRGTGDVIVNLLGTIALTGTSGILVGQSAGAVGALTIDGGLVTGDSSAYFNLGFGSGATGTLVVDNFGTLSLLSGMGVGASSGASGQMTVNGGFVSVASGLSLGESGTGTLTIGGGGTVEANGGLFIATGTGSGTLSVNGGSLITNGLGIGNSGQGTLSISGGGLVTNSGSFSLNVGFNAGSNGTVIVSGGTLVDTSGAYFGVGGANANGSLTIGTGGTVFATSTFLDVNATGTGVASAEINGGRFIDTNNSFTDLIVGDTGHGSLDITNFGTANVGNAAVSVGNQTGGAGTLTLENGGSLIAGALDLDTSPGATATAVATIGSGGVVEAAVDVGTQGTLTNQVGGSIFGSVTNLGSLVNNGLIVTGASTTSNMGTVTGTGTVEIGPNAEVGFNAVAGNSQSVVFEAGGNNTFVIGNPGTGYANSLSGLYTGDRIEFGNGMTVTSASLVGGNTIAVDFHNSVGNPGTYNLTNVSLAAGSGQAFSVGSDITTGDSFVQLISPLPPRTLVWTGATGTNFDISTNWDDITDGLNPAAAPPTSIDTVEFNSGGGAISGAGTAASLQFGGGAWNLNSLADLTTTGSVVVGATQSAVLLIENGASIVGAAGAIIANTSSASGSEVDVTGIGSSWQVGGTLVVGNAGFGDLSLSQGASVTATSLDMGAAAGGDGIVSIVGASTALNLTGNLTVGDQSTGELTILSGAKVTAGAGSVGGSSSASPSSVDIEGAGSQLTVNGGNLTIGGSGPAVFTLGKNTVLTLNGGNLITGINGTFNQSGTVDPPNVVNDGVTNLTGGAATLADISVENSGAFTIKNGPVSIYTPLVTYDPNPVTDLGSTTGLWQIDTLGTLVLNTTSVDASQTIQFNALNGVLVIGQQPDIGLGGTVTGTVSPGDPNVLPGFDAPIQNFKAGDQILFTGLVYGSDTQVANTVTLWSGAAGTGTDLGSLSFITLSGGPSTSEAVLAAAQIESNATALCFLAGTLIQTPSGEREVEQLAVGDSVVTASGVVRPIEWIGVGKVLATRGRRNAATPVIVRKGALGANVPYADLRVTKGHSLLLDGVLIPVEFLVNHRSILWDDRAQEVSIYHVELATHDVLVANGAAAESYRDDGNRWLFQNGNAGWGEPPKPPCAPVLTGGAVVDAVWRRLLDAAGPRPSVPLTEDADVHLLVDGVRVDPTRQAGEAYVFRLPTPSSDVRLVSRSVVPQELGLARDARELGVAVRSVAVRQGTRFRTIKASDARLADGFHAYEATQAARWTDGHAALPSDLFTGFTGPVELVLTLAATARYPLLGGSGGQVAA